MQYRKSKSYKLVVHKCDPFILREVDDGVLVMSTYRTLPIIVSNFRVLVEGGR